MGAAGFIQAVGAAASAYGSYQQGKTEKITADANAQVYEAQAKNIGEMQKITAGQYRTKANVLRGQATATAARGGLKISGSTANSISQSIMELQMDNAYEQYNLAVKKQNAYNDAAIERIRGKQAYKNGLYGAANTVLSTASSLYSKYWGGSTNTANSNSFGTTIKHYGSKISNGIYDFTHGIKTRRNNNAEAGLMA